MAKKNVNRAKQYKHQNRHLLKKAVATVGAAVKEAPKKVEKAAKAAAKEVKQAASSVEEFAASLEGVALIVRKHSMMKVFALLRTSQTGQKKSCWPLKESAQLQSRN